MKSLRSIFGASETIVVVGSLLVVFAATLATVYWPMYTIQDKPSDQWRADGKIEELGRQRFIANGCTYCHSQYVRPQDWGEGAERIAETGDYYKQQPHLLGSERTGPDLSQQGGEHTEDWHQAHFANPRLTRTRSLMPSFAYEGERNISALIAYMQSLGGKNADGRMAVQRKYRKQALAAFRKGPDANIQWLHSRVPLGWRITISETPAVEASVKRGEKVYQDYCLGCHGPVGDGNGPAAPYLKPTPVNFTILRRHLVDGKYIGGILYYQIMNGITGTAMPYFKKDLESAKIWDVGNFVSVYFINYRDDQLPNEGIPAAYEGGEAGAPSPQPSLRRGSGQAPAKGERESDAPLPNPPPSGGRSVRKGGIK